MQKVIDGKDTFLHWREVAAREPENAEALWQLLGRQAMHDMPEEAAATRKALAALPPERNPHAYDLLVDAIHARDAESARRLIAAGVEVEKDDGGRSTPLAVAVDRGLEEIVSLLIEAGADPKAALRGGPALHVAARKGHAGIARLLIEAGADVNAKSRRGEMALAIAIAAASRDVARVLLEKGADATEDERARVESMPDDRLVASTEGPVWLCAAAEGAILWVTMGGTAGAELCRLDPTTGEVETLLGGLENPRGVAAGDAGVWVVEAGSAGDAASGRLSRHDPAAGRFEVVLDGLSYPEALCAGAGGGVFFTEWDVVARRQRIYRLRPGAKEAEPVAEGSGFAALAADEHGNPVAARVDRYGRDTKCSLVRFAPASPEGEAFASGLGFVRCLAVDTAGNAYVGTYASARGRSGVHVLPAGGTGAPVPLRSGPNVWSIAAPKDGTVYYSTTEGEVRALEVDLAKALGNLRDAAGEAVPGAP